MLLLQQAREDHSTEKKVMGWQDGKSVHLLFSMCGGWLENSKGEKNMKNYHPRYYHDYQFHAKPTISSGEVDNGEKL